MSETVKVQDAKTRLSALLAEVEHGREYVIARGDRPIARLIPLAAAPERELGFAPYDPPGTFFDPLPEDELEAWQQ